MTIVKAPVVNLLLTVQFTPAAAGLNILDLAELRESFPELPLFKQVVRARSMSHDPYAEDTDLSGGLPRVQFLSEDLTRSFLFQEDRLTVAWQDDAMTGEKYPGYSALLEDLIRYIDRVISFMKERGQSIRPNSGEIYYRDMLPLRAEGDKWPELSDVLQIYIPKPDLEIFGYASGWRVHLTEPRLEGFATVSFEAPKPRTDKEAAVEMETSVSFSLQKVDWSEILPLFELGHNEALRLFRTMVKPEIVSTLGV